MNAAVVAVLAIGIFYFFGYRFWSRVLAEKVFALSGEERTPANDPDLQDGVDYVPTNKHVLWGHHYASIAGAAPIIGPAVAVFWGWVPAILWIVFGTIFIGAVHDFGALVLSSRKKGHTMAELAGDIIHPRVRILFQLIIYFLIWIVLAVFGIAIGTLFHEYPATVIPVNFQIVIALVIGLLLHRKGAKILIPSIVALFMLYALIPVGIAWPLQIPAFSLGGSEFAPATTWAILLLIYSGIASVLPVWLLLQPRDYINSHMLVVGLTLLFLGLFILHPEITAPAVNTRATGAPPLFPLLFVTIACGAISGFHGLVSSGTTSKQLNDMRDARAIGYGGMLGEGILAVVATLAVAAGLENWNAHYHDWSESGGLAIAKFAQGAGNFVAAIPGFTVEASRALVAILAISFAATSMDTGARIQRFIVSELANDFGFKWLANRYVATLVAVVPSIPLVLAGSNAWGPLWLLFGTTNQLIGGMTLLVLFVYLFRSRRPLMQYALPMIFVVLMTTGAMIYSLYDWISKMGTANASANWLTISVGGVILILELWMIVEAVIILRKLQAERAAGEDALEEAA